MNTTTTFQTCATLVLLQTLSAHSAMAFSEDLCVFSTSEGPMVQNCLDAKACDPKNGDTRACHANVVWQMGKTTIGNGIAASRSMLHTDATFYLAQKAGFTAEAAWWIAAYDQAADLGAYAPFDASGQVLETWKGLPVRTVEVNGFERTSFISAGSLMHVHAPTYRGDEIGYSSLRPDLEDTKHEAFLNHLRQWAFADTTLCAGGYLSDATLAEDASSTRCFGQNDLLTSAPQTLPYHLYLLQPLFTGGGASTPVAAAGAFGGEQLAVYTPSGESGPKNITEVGLADDMASVLEAGYSPEAWATLQNTSAGPELDLLARTGIYLHAAQDRISHHECSDASVSTHEASPKLAEGVYVTRYDADACSQSAHAFGHFEEIGRGSAGVPERTLSALALTYRELRALASTLPKRSSLLTVRASAASDTLQSADESALGQALSVPGACQRVAAMLRLNEQAGFGQMPGYASSQLASMCKTTRAR